MKPGVLAASALAAAAAVVVIRRRQHGSPPGPGALRAARSGWLSVTVNRDPDEVVQGGRVPAPLAEFGDAVEVQVHAAPADKGSELRARFRSDGSPRADDSGPDRDRRGRLRAALREAKQLIEVGEVLRVDPVPHGRRTGTPTGLLVDVAAERSNQGGTL